MCYLLFVIFGIICVVFNKNRKNSYSLNNSNHADLKFIPKSVSYAK